MDANAVKTLLRQVVRPLLEAMEYHPRPLIRPDPFFWQHITNSVKLLKSPAWRRTQAVVTIVTAISPDESRHYLEELARGHPDAMVTIKAKEALTRMNKSRNTKQK
jgi:5-bromo-4-chloroindolyl phosphate hydrolysis protein